MLRKTWLRYRLDLGLALLLYLGLATMVHPANVQWLGREEAFAVATSIAFLVSCTLALRWTVRLFRLSRGFIWNPEERAVGGTVMAEFALVLPVVLLLIGTVVQIALISQAALVLRYASFVAARSAMVQFEAEASGNALHTIWQVAPLPEPLDIDRPEQAALMVLASISGRAASSDTSSSAMNDVLLAQGEAWQGGNYEERFAYADRATTQDWKPGDEPWGEWWDSVRGQSPNSVFSPFIPRSTHALQPARQRSGDGTDNAYLLPKPPELVGVIPDRIEYELPLDLPSPLDKVPGLPSSIPINIPLPSEINDVASALDDTLDLVRTGSAQLIRDFADGNLNNDWFGPKPVSLNLIFDFRLAIPSLIQLVPGMTVESPDGNGRAFRLEHWELFRVDLQSTGGRRGVLGAIPKVPDVYNRSSIPNTPLYWRLRK